jgi:hypothetical protein
MKLKRHWAKASLWTAAAVCVLFLLFDAIGPSQLGSVPAASVEKPPGVYDPSRVSPFGEPSSTDIPFFRKSFAEGWGDAAMGRPEPPPLSTMSPPRFSADARGHLVLNAQTQQNVEQFFVLGSPQAIQTQLREVSSNLPDSAQSELKTLVARYQDYITAQGELASSAPGTVQVALQQLDQLHALRVSYFGEESTKALFGDDEATARAVMSLAAGDKDPNSTLEQKMERALMKFSPSSNTRISPGG